MSDMERDGALWMLKDVYGFKNLPPDGDYKAFIKAVLICAKGDGVLATEERDWVVGRAAAYRNTGYEIAKTYEADEDLLYVLSQAPPLLSISSFNIFLTVFIFFDFLAIRKYLLSYS